MSGAGTAAKPPLMWCWSCSRRLHARFHRIVIGPDGHKHVVHAQCAERDGLEVVPGKHLSTQAQRDEARLSGAATPRKPTK